VVTMAETIIEVVASLGVFVGPRPVQKMFDP
jgi:hypothetical protein